MSKVITKRQRAQVVELLRCGCDRWGCAMPFSSAVSLLGPSKPVERVARKAWLHVYYWAVRKRVYGVRVAGGRWWASMQWTLLEAAARVEEGSLP